MRQGCRCVSISSASWRTLLRTGQARLVATHPPTPNCTVHTDQLTRIQLSSNSLTLAGPKKERSIEVNASWWSPQVVTTSSGRSLSLWCSPVLAPVIASPLPYSFTQSLTHLPIYSLSDRIQARRRLERLPSGSFSSQPWCQKQCNAGCRAGKC